MRNTSTANAVVCRSVGVLAIDSMTATRGARMLLVKSKVHDGACLMLSLEDTGTGINPEDIQRIFNPLFTTKSNGMGLSICRSIIEARGGKLWVEPNTGGGATLHLTLTTAPSPSIRRLKLGPFFRASERERPDRRSVNAASRTLPHHTVLPLCTFSKSLTLLLCDTTSLNSATLAPKRSLMAIGRGLR